MNNDTKGFNSNLEKNNFFLKMVDEFNSIENKIAEEMKAGKIDFVSESDFNNYVRRVQADLLAGIWDEAWREKTPDFSITAKTKVTEGVTQEQRLV